MAIRVVVADPHPITRIGLSSGLSLFGIEVVAEIGSGAALAAAVTETAAAAVLMNVRLMDTDGVEAMLVLRNALPGVPVVMMATHDNPHFISRASSQGAQGFLLKDSPIEKFAEILQAAATGEATFNREELRRAAGALTSPRLGPEHDVPLTFRECEVLIHMGDGLTNKLIGERLGISYETVKEHVQHILQKIGVVDRTQAVYWGLCNGVIPLPPGLVLSHPLRS